MTENKRIITPPSDHAGICRALRHSFGRAPNLPEEWRRLLDRLR